LLLAKLILLLGINPGTAAQAGEALPTQGIKGARSSLKDKRPKPASKRPPNLPAKDSITFMLTFIISQPK